MFNLFRRPRVEFVELNHHQLAFRSRRVFPIGKVLDLDLVLGDGHPVPIRVQMERSRPLEKGGFLCTGELIRATVPLEAAAPAVPADESQLRGRARLPCRLRVLSRQLPGYRAVSVDFHHGGLQLETEGKMDAGEVLELALDLIPDAPPLACLAEVAWCEDIDRGRFRMGVRFLAGTPDLTEKLALYEEVLRSPDDKAPYLRLLRLLRASLEPQTRTQERWRIQGQLLAYDTGERDLRLDLTMDGQVRRIFFPGARMVRDQRGPHGNYVSQLRRMSDSPELRQLEQPELEHYKLLNPRGATLFEVISESADLRPIIGDGPKQSPGSRGQDPFFQALPES